MNQAKAKPPKRCYLCNRQVRRYKLPKETPLPPDFQTRDHIPPENLFPRGFKENLITVVSCHECNGRFKSLDEDFRIWVTTQANVSATGTQVMRKDVFGGTFKSSPGVKKRVAREMLSTVRIETPDGDKTVSVMAVPKKKFEPYFVRITKGLLSQLYPALDYHSYIFRVSDPTYISTHQQFPAFAKCFTQGERGRGIFRFWHRVNPQEHGSGIWMLQFYEAAIFTITHAESEDDFPR